MLTGVVSKWIDDRGFGFIQPDDGGEQVFVHMKALWDGNDYLTQGEIVQYEDEVDVATGKARATSCSGGYNGGEWSLQPRKDKGTGKCKGQGFDPYGGGKGFGSEQVFVHIKALQDAAGEHVQYEHEFDEASGEFNPWKY